jgi:hypothetical protein
VHDVPKVPSENVRATDGSTADLELRPDSADR